MMIPPLVGKERRKAGDWFVVSSLTEKAAGAVLTSLITPTAPINKAPTSRLRPTGDPLSLIKLAGSKNVPFTKYPHPIAPIVDSTIARLPPPTSSSTMAPVGHRNPHLSPSLFPKKNAQSCL